MPFVDISGAQLAYRIDGEGPDLVLVHAGIADMRMWDPLVALLARRFRMVRYDMRGHGATTTPAGAFSDSDDLAALMSALEIEHCALVGASFGGLVALEFAATHPELIERLVVIDPPLPGWDWSEEMGSFFAAENAALEAKQIEEAVRLNVERFAGSAKADVKELVADMQERALRLQLAVDIEPVELDPPVSNRLTEIAMPVTVVHGEHDVQDFVVIAHTLAERLPSATLHCVARAGHLPALERPEAVAELIVSRR
jgi:pimeloyl-ACP methyl ester carboxylesterase